MSKTDPCYKCNKRKIGCHSKCEDYIEWVVRIREIKKARFKEKGLEMISDQYQIDKARRLHKLTNK